MVDGRRPHADRSQTPPARSLYSLEGQTTRKGAKKKKRREGREEREDKRREDKRRREKRRKRREEERREEDTREEREGKRRGKDDKRQGRASRVNIDGIEDLLYHPQLLRLDLNDMHDPIRIVLTLLSCRQVHAYGDAKRTAC